MGVATEEELPAGWNSFEKDKVIYEIRCPWGEQCKKLGILLYTSQNKDTVLDSAAMHMCNQDNHTEFNDFNLARSCAEIGLTEKIKKSRVFYERSTEHGTEQKEPR